MVEDRKKIILLVEDDPGDQKLIKVSMNALEIKKELHIVSNSEEALDFLYRRGRYEESAPMPDLIILDLNMPGMGGKELLKRLKQDEKLKRIPVIILTTSDFDRDILESYNLQASGYVKKPVDIVGLKEIIITIGKYWFETCILPTELNLEV